MQHIEHFLGSDLPEGFYWFNEPGRYRLGNGLEIFTDEKTDSGSALITAFGVTMVTAC